MSSGLETRVFCCEMAITSSLSLLTAKRKNKSVSFWRFRSLTLPLALTA